MTKKVNGLSQLELTAEEEKELRNLEDRIVLAVCAIESNWRDLAQCLATIRERRLYRQSHSSFEAYCRERHGQSARRINQLIAGNTVLENLGTRVPTNLPKTEKQVRPLAQLPADEQAKAWKESQNRSGLTQPPASVVERVVKERQKRQKNCSKPNWAVGDVVCVQDEDQEEFCKVLLVGNEVSKLQDAHGNVFCVDNQFVTPSPSIPIRPRSLILWEDKYYWVTELFGTDRCQIVKTSPPSEGVKLDTYKEDCKSTQLCVFQSQLMPVLVPLVTQKDPRPLATTNLTVWGKPRQIVARITNAVISLEWELTDGRGKQTTQVPIDRVKLGA
jgi:hypothetical protein